MVECNTAYRKGCRDEDKKNCRRERKKRTYSLNADERQREKGRRGVRRTNKTISEDEEQAATDERGTRCAERKVIEKSGLQTRLGQYISFLRLYRHMACHHVDGCKRENCTYINQTWEPPSKK